jgi:hypothetical protein
MLKDELHYNGVTLLTYAIEYPEFHSFRFKNCMPKINRYYRKRAVRFQRYCREVLFPMAVEQYQYDVANGYPIRSYEAIQTFHVTYDKDCIVSLYYDQYQYTGGAHGNTVRHADTWNLAACHLLYLNQLVFCPPDYKTFILGEVEAQIKIEPELYFDDYQTLIRETFNNNNFYCTEEGIIVYYQQYDIAPYASGIREFLIPYNSCVVDPQKFCSTRE